MPNTEADFVNPQDYRNTNWNEADVVWNIGFFSHVDCFLDTLKALFPHIKTVNTWVGTDILSAMEWFDARPKCARCALRSIDIHVADGTNLQAELKQYFGLDCFYVPSIPDPIPLTPLPQFQKNVAVYCPSHRKEFYHYNAILQLAQKEPSFNFHFFSITPDPDPPKLVNAYFEGFFLGEEKTKAFTECSYLIVLPQHGSVSMMLIEFMQMGRRVISNIDAPFVYKVSTPITSEQLQEQLKRAYQDTLKTGVNESASKYYHKEYGIERVKETIHPILEKIEKMGEFVY